MKNTLIFLLFIILTSCSESNDKNIDYTNNHIELLGTWKYVEYFGIDLDCLDCGPYLITDGYTITFKKDGTFESNELIDYPKGTYNVSSSDQITFKYFSAKTDHDQIIVTKEIFSISNNDLILDMNCWEGCSERFEKLD